MSILYRSLRFRLTLELSRVYPNEPVAPPHAFNSPIGAAIDDADEPGSSSGNNPLFWDAARRVIICRWCGHAIGPRWVSKHLQEKHHELLSLSARTRILESLPLEQAIEGSDRAGMLLAEQHGYSPYLTVHSDGHLCMMRGCGYACVKSSTMGKHVAAHDSDNGWNGHVGPQTMAPVSVSTIFNHPKHYFVVMPPDDPHAAFSSDLNPGASAQSDQSLLPENPFFTQEDLSPLRLKFQAHRQRQSEALAIAPSQTIHQTPWDIRTRWPAHFEGANMVRLYQLTEVDSRDDPPGYTRRLHSVLGMLLDQCDREARQHSTLVLRILHCAQPGGHTPGQPFNLVRRSTLQSKYAIWWRRLLLFLLRAVQPANADLLEYHISISASQRSLIQDLDRLLRTPQPTKPTDSQPGLDPADVQILAAVKMLSESLIFSRITRSPFQSPLIVFVGCVGYQAYTGTWRRAHETTPMLSGLIHIMRLLSLHSVLPVAELDRIEDPPAVLRQAAETYLQDGTSTPFTELYSLRAYGEQIGKHFFSRPTVIWSADMQTLIFEGNALRIADLGSMMQQLIINTEDLLCEQLVFQDREYLKTKQPCGLTDDWTWRRIGDSLVDVVQPRDHLQHEGECLILHSALCSSKGRRLFVKTNNSFAFSASGQS